MDKKVSGLINSQVNKEFYSAYLYFEFANFYQECGLDGFYNWFYVQAQEEMDHALLMVKYLQNNEEKVVFEAIGKPETPAGDNLQPLKAALAHEKYITGEINEIYAAANTAKDFRTMQFLDWFVKEQGEEEKNASDLIRKMELFGGDARSLYLLDAELKTRVYAAPSLIL